MACKYLRVPLSMLVLDTGYWIFLTVISEAPRGREYLWPGADAGESISTWLAVSAARFNRIHFMWRQSAAAAGGLEGSIPRSDNVDTLQSSVPSITYLLVPIIIVVIVLWPNVSIGISITVRGIT